MRPTASARAGISLKSLLPQGQFVGTRDVEFRSCCGRWDECQRDDLYVAIVDGDGDGHDHAPQALDRGAAAIVGERLLAVRSPQCIVEDTRPAYARICHALVGDPTTRLRAIGVTGSAGKTVTSHLIQAVLRAAGESAGLLTSLEPLDPPRGRPFELPPPALAQALADMVVAGQSHVVLEAPSTALAQHHLAGVELDVAVVTNLSREHLDFHGTRQNYLAAKSRLLDGLRATGFAVLNADDAGSRPWLDEIGSPALTVGIRHPAEITGQMIERSAGEQTMLIRAGHQSIPVRTRMIGEHHLSNCLLATAVGLALGIDLPVIARGLESVTSLPGRLEPVAAGQPFSVFVDCGATPRQLATSLHALRRVTTGRLICVATQHPEQTADERSRIGRVLERGCDKYLLTSNRLNAAGDYEPYHEILDGMDSVAAAHILPDRMLAIEQALRLAGPGDTVLVSGRGEQPIGTAGDLPWPIHDRDVCQAWLIDRDFRDPPQTIYRLDDYR